MKLFIYIFLGIVLSFLSCKRENNRGISIDSSNEIQKLIEKNADSLLSNSDLKSVSIGIYRNGKSYIGHFGELDRGNKPTNNTIYELASVTKTFTGVLVAKAVLDNKIDLNDDLRKFLKEEYPNLQYEGTPITIRHLLTHTSGLNLFFHNKLNETLRDFGKNDSISIRGNKLLERYDKEKFFELLHEVKLDTIPGIKFSYSNDGVELLAHILERAYNKSYGELLIEHVFSKAGMNNTVLEVTEQDQIEYANGYGISDTIPVPHWTSTRWGSSVQLKSTMPDMVKYLKFQLDTTNLHIIKSHEVLLEKENTPTMAYLWFKVNNNRKGSYYFHHGGVWGMQNYLVLFPKHNTGISIITNSSREDTGAVLWDAIEALIEDIEPLVKKSIVRAIKPVILKDIERGIALYHELMQKSNNEYDFSDENGLTDLAYKFLWNGKHNEAIKVFNLIVKEFPNSANAYDNLGEAYFISEQYDLALINYKKSLDLNPSNKNPKQKIEAIQNLNNE